MLLKPIRFYFSEILIRCTYLIFSYLLCISIFFQYVELIILFEVYPYISISYNRFIVTKITDLLNLVLILSLFFSTFFVLPFVKYHILSFFSASWYEYQLKLFFCLSKIIFIISINLVCIFHFYILPILLNFFLYWEIKEYKDLVKIELEAQVLFYIYWVLSFKSFILSLFLLFIVMFITFILLLESSCTYLFYKTYKNIFVFCTIFFFFLALPPDFILQIITLFFIFLFYELFFILLCFNFFKLYFKI